MSEDKTAPKVATPAPSHVSIPSGLLLEALKLLTVGALAGGGSYLGSSPEVAQLQMQEVQEDLAELKLDQEADAAFLRAKIEAMDQVMRSGIADRYPRTEATRDMENLENRIRALEIEAGRRGL